MRDINKR